MRREKICGIYKITNKVNDKCYIGKAKDIYYRFSAHKTNAKKDNPDTRSSPLLFYALKKYGESNFKFEIIEILELDDDLLKVRELYWMDYFNSYQDCCGYNLRRDSSTSMIVHPKTLEKMSNNLKEQWAKGIRSEHSKKLSESWKNNEERSKLQSELFSKTLTKYSYNIYTENEEFIKNVFYRELYEFGLENCFSAFHRNKLEKVKFKNFIVERVTLY